MGFMLVVKPVKATAPCQYETSQKRLMIRVTLRNGLPIPELELLQRRSMFDDLFHVKEAFPHVRRCSSKNEKERAYQLSVEEILHSVR